MYEAVEPRHEMGRQSVSSHDVWDTSFRLFSEGEEAVGFGDAEALALLASLGEGRTETASSRPHWTRTEVRASSQS